MITGTQQLEIQELTTREDLEAIRPEWSVLRHRCPSATPFQSPEWLLPWWNRFGTGDLWTLTLYESSRLAGIAPLFVSRPRKGAPRQLSFLGSGVPGYSDITIEPRLGIPGTEMVLDRLERRKDKWEIADFQGLRADSPLLAAADIPGINRRILVPEVCPVLVPADSAGKFYSGLVPKFRARLAQARKSLEKRGDLRSVTATEHDLAKLIGIMFDMSTGPQGRMESTALRAFFREAGSELLVKGWLRLSALLLDERIIAVQYAISEGGSLYFCRGGQDTGLAGYYPLSLLTELMLLDAIREGLREIHFLTGGQRRKYPWGALGRRKYALLLWHSAGNGQDAKSCSGENPGVMLP